MMKYTLVINYRSMENVGGIEKYVFRQTRFMINNGHRVIWLCDKEPRVANSFSSIMLSDDVERYDVNTHGVNWFDVPKIKFNKDETIVIVSFEPIEMAQSELFCHEYEEYNIRPLYLVPDTTGNQYFLERNFKGILNKKVLKCLKEYIGKWEKNDAIRFFSETQIKPLESAYAVNIKRKDEKVLKTIEQIEDIDLQLIKNKAENRNPFVIMTIGRFDFPHKGYMLGLVRSIAQLNEKYHNLVLKIIGFGKDESILREEISKLNKDMQDRIILLGEVAPDEIKKHVQDVHLNISVAGAVGSGAICGVLSIPARNYCEGECEVYGYLPQSRKMTTSLEPGLPVENFIEDVINMSNAEYIQKCIDSYDIYKPKSVDPLYIFHTTQNNVAYKFDNKEIRFFKRVTYLKKIKDKICSK